MRRSSRYLHEAYEKWCVAEGEQPKLSGEFGKTLNERGFISRRGAQGVRTRLGINLVYLRVTLVTGNRKSG